MRIKLHETIARYLLGAYYMLGAIDGAVAIFYGIHLTGEAHPHSFLGVLANTLFFWAFLKLVELVGAISLLLNYKPALGTALVTPISAVLCLFYLFDVHWYYACAVVAILNLVLLKAYWNSYRPLFDAYPMRAKKATQ